LAGAFLTGLAGFSYFLATALPFFSGSAFALPFYGVSLAGLFYPAILSSFSGFAAAASLAFFSL
jgi:hypothetical protein